MVQTHLEVASDWTVLLPGQAPGGLDWIPEEEPPLPLGATPLLPPVAGSKQRLNLKNRVYKLEACLTPGFGEGLIDYSLGLHLGRNP